MSKKIKLTQGKFAIVDDEDYQRINAHHWHISKRGNDFIAVRELASPRNIIRMHQEILNTRKNVMHSNHDYLNNKKANLKINDRTTAQQHRRKSELFTSSIYKGVYYNKHAKKWQASITVFKKRKFLGLYVDEKAAARAYDRAALKYFEEFAWTNFQTNGEDHEK